MKNKSGSDCGLHHSPIQICWQILNNEYYPIGQQHGLWRNMALLIVSWLLYHRLLVMEHPVIFFTPRITGRIFSSRQGSSPSDLFWAYTGYLERISFVIFSNLTFLEVYTHSWILFFRNLQSVIQWTRFLHLSLYFSMLSVISLTSNKFSISSLRCIS